MLAIIFTALAAVAFLILVFGLVPRGVGMTAMAVAVAGAVVAFTVTLFSPPTATTDTYALRPLTPGAKDPSYLSVSGGRTGYAYDDSGTVRTGSTAAHQKVEVRDDGAGQPRVEITRETYGNQDVAPWSMTAIDRIVFHVPAGSALISAAAG